jgi:hypothetical protein
MIVQFNPDARSQLRVLGRPPYRFPTPLACRFVVEVAAIA